MREHRGTLKRNQKVQDMMIPIDPIMAAVVVIGVFIYFALKGNPSKKEDKSIYDIYREIGENSSENKRYQRWLDEHK